MDEEEVLVIMSDRQQLRNEIRKWDPYLFQQKKPGPLGQIKYGGFAVFVRNHTRNLNRIYSGFFRYKQKRLRA